MSRRRRGEAAVVRPPEVAAIHPVDRRQPHETPAEAQARETLERIRAAEETAAAERRA